MSQKDGGWGWVIVCTCFFNGFLFDGVAYSYGLIFVELLDVFNESTALTAGIGSMLFGMSLVGPLAGMVSNRFGCRVTTVIAGTIFAIGYISSAFSTGVIYLYFSIGILLGVGHATLELTRTVIIVQYFDKRRSFARGLSICGSGIGTIVFNPLSRWLIDEYGWRGALLIEGGIALNTVACGLLMRPFSVHRDSETKAKLVVKMEERPLNTLEQCSPLATDKIIDRSQEYGDQRQGVLQTSVEQEITNGFNPTRSDSDVGTMQTVDSKRWLDITLLKNPYFIVVFFSAMFEGFAFNTPFTFIPEMAVSSGWTRHEATWIMTAIGITVTAGRMFLAFVLDLKCLNKVLAYATIQFLEGITVAAIPFCQQYSTLMAVCVFFGGLASPLVTADLFGAKFIADTYGLNYFAFGVGNLIAGPITGAIFDASASYTTAFIAIGVTFVLSGFLYVPMYIVTRNRETTLHK